MSSDWYILDEKHDLVEVASYAVAKEWTRANPNLWRVGVAEIGDARISTVFMRTDWGCGTIDRPWFFETMIFGGRLDGDQWYYSTWAEAEAGHKAAVALVTASAGGKEVAGA